jgi:hypothetical protein
VKISVIKKIINSIKDIATEKYLNNLAANLMKARTEYSGERDLWIYYANIS